MKKKDYAAPGSDVNEKLMSFISNHPQLQSKLLDLQKVYEDKQFKLKDIHDMGEIFFLTCSVAFV